MIILVFLDKQEVAGMNALLDSVSMLHWS